MKLIIEMEGQQEIDEDRELTARAAFQSVIFSLQVFEDQLKRHYEQLLEELQTRGSTSVAAEDRYHHLRLTIRKPRNGEIIPPRFERYQWVQWESEAGGYRKTKQGRILAVVAPGDPDPRATWGEHFPSADWQHIKRTTGRRKESYLVGVWDIWNGGRYIMYWPRVSHLQPWDGPK